MAVFLEHPVFEVLNGMMIKKRESSRSSEEAIELNLSIKRLNGIEKEFIAL
jgi:hypothetical protein